MDILILCLLTAAIIGLRFQIGSSDLWVRALYFSIGYVSAKLIQHWTRD